MSDLMLLLSLTLAVALGWWLGSKQNKPASTALPSMDMLMGDRQSETVQAILDMAEREEAFELQLSLGTFYRRRGEIEKAIAIHQSLFARPDLDKNLGAQVQLALATDYLNAGLYDRAERLLLELCKGSSKLRVEATEKLICIYEEEQDWEKILKLDSYAHMGSQGIKPVAYACCELADRAMKDRDWTVAERYIHQALKLDPYCIRALMLDAELADNEGLPKRVITSLKEVLNIDPSLLPLVQPKLTEIFEARHRPDDLEEILTTLWSEAPMPLTLHSLARHLAQEQGVDVSIQLLTQSLLKVPTVEGFALLLEQLIQQDQAVSVEYLGKIKRTIDQLRSHQEGYHCHHCGFQAEKYYWRCPSCKHWETYKPNMALAELAS